ncbi:hypothetical protein PG994_007198 [Apiospora phragmitis]|uniref:BTB domain-containing protein n=1 Tax=Apiospora phragmitis TaxID=2905665 RepID=A0ABR1V055_9PEZI
MEETGILHEIDPDGDIELILQNPNAPFAVWVQDQGTPAAKKRKYNTAFGREPSLFHSVDQCYTHSVASNAARRRVESTATPAPAQDEQRKQQTTIRFRVSSKHLALASVSFRNFLQDDSQGGNASTFKTSGWDPDAMLILMNIIHGRHGSVPTKVNLEMFAKIAALTDYPGCHEAVMFFARGWISKMSVTTPNKYDRNLVLWLAVSRVLSRQSIFVVMAKAAIMYSKGPIQTLGLPIPQQVVGKQR